MEEREIIGYKSFNKDCTNRHGELFEAGKTYHEEGEISFGNSSKAGFHMCKRLEDTLRYFPAFEEDIKIAKVIGRGNIVEYEDDYYGYYDMYAVQEITIERFLEREEIINMFLQRKGISEDQVCRFTQLYKLTEDEIALFKERYDSSDKITKFIEYYQEDDKEAFTRNKYLK